MKTKYHYYLFRLVSSRGTDIHRCYKLPADMSKDDIKSSMECKAEILTSGTACQEYSVTYRKIKLPDRRTLLKQYRTAVDKHTKAKLKKDELAQMLNPY